MPNELSEISNAAQIAARGAHTRHLVETLKNLEARLREGGGRERIEKQQIEPAQTKITAVPGPTIIPIKDAPTIHQRLAKIPCVSIAPAVAIVAFLLPCSLSQKDRGPVRLRFGFVV